MAAHRPQPLEAAVPAASVGREMAVRGGAVSGAIGTSSPPTTLISSGTAMPSRDSPAMTPSAIWALNATTAVAPVATMASTASAPASKVGGPTPTSCTVRPVAWLLRRTASRRSVAAHDAFGPPTYASWR